MLRKLAGFLRHVIQLLRGILPLHAIQDVVRFLQTLAGALLSGIGLIGISALLVLGLPHIVGSTRQSIERLLQPWIGSGAGSLLLLLLLRIGLRRLALLTLLSLLTLLPGLALLSWLAWGGLLLRRISAGELLHLPLQLFRFTTQHFLLPLLPESLLLVFICGQFLLAAR